MVKRILVVLSIIAIIGICGINMASAQQADESDMSMQQDEGTSLTGVVTEVAEDGSSLFLFKPI